MVRRGLLGGLLAVAVAVVLVPHLTGTAWSSLASVDGGWLTVALVLEAGSLATYAALTRAVLPVQGRPRCLRLLGIDLTTMAAGHVVPAGSAVGLGVGYRLLTAEGVRGPAAVFAKATQAVGSAVVLNLLLWVALVLRRRQPAGVHRRPPGPRRGRRARRGQLAARRRGPVGLRARLG